MNFNFMARWSLAAIFVVTTVQNIAAQEPIVEVQVQDGQLQISGSRSNDEIMLTPGRRSGDVRIQGMGATQVSLNGRSPRAWVRARGISSLDVRMRGGDDLIMIEGLELGEAVVKLNGGDDSAIIQDSGFEMLSFAGGREDDTLQVGGVSAGLTVLVGGNRPSADMSDVLMDLGNNDLGMFEAIGFEVNEFADTEEPEPEMPELPDPEVVIDSLTGPDTIDLSPFVSELVRYDSVDDAPPTNNSFTLGRTERLFEFSNGTERLPADVIDLTAIDANVNTPGDDAFVFIGDAEFSGTPGELRATFRPQMGGFIPAASFVTGDIDGDGEEDFTILLINNQFGALMGPVGLTNFRL